MPIDYTKYPKNWKTEIRPAILERAKHCCEECGVANYAIGYRAKDGSFVSEREMSGMNSDEGYHTFGCWDPKQIKIVLTIAHLDHDITNNCYSNLAALCQRCHLNHDRAHHSKNAKATRMQKMGVADLFEQ